MNQSELRDKLWAELPFLRRKLVGRERFDDIFTIAVEQFPISLVGHVTQGSKEQDVFAAAWGQSVRRGYDLLYGEDATFGPLFWILLSPLIQYVVGRLLEWWFVSSANRIKMAGWQRELTK